MLISTILLIADLVAWVWHGVPLFSFWNFLWIYPLEIIVYIVLWVLGILGLMRIVK
jgi:hypothetical protein